MPTPAEIARVVEQFDETQWYDFLEELDAVSRRRRRHQSEPEPPEGHDRDRMAAWLARRHFLADSGVREIWYLPDNAPPDEIRLLEVNERLALPAAEPPRVEAIEFALGMGGDPIRLFVADVTSDEIDQIKATDLPLPPGWGLAGNTIWRRGG